MRVTRVSVVLSLLSSSLALNPSTSPSPLERSLMGSIISSFSPPHWGSPVLGTHRNPPYHQQSYFSGWFLPLGSSHDCCLTTHSDPNFEFSIDGHSLTIIEVDASFPSSRTMFSVFLTLHRLTSSSTHSIRSAGSDTYNFDNPVIRDVVSTGPSTTDNTTFRFVTDNAGPWILHCHIDWHLVIGLAVVFAENVPSIAAEKTPTSWQKLRPIYDSLSSS
ncbi:Cupredoxin [Mycena epipterygia]|nr:Cupredoxin [Mycena epipterygia]